MGRTRSHRRPRQRSCAATRVEKALVSRADTRPPRGYRRRPTASEVRVREVAPHLTAGPVDVFRRDVEPLPDAAKARSRPLGSPLPPKRLHELQDLLLLLLREVERLLGDQVPRGHRQLQPERLYRLSVSDPQRATRDARLPRSGARPNGTAQRHPESLFDAMTARPIPEPGLAALRDGLGMEINNPTGHPSPRPAGVLLYRDDRELDRLAARVLRLVLDAAADEL